MPAEIVYEDNLKRVAIILILPHALVLYFRMLFFAKPVSPFAQHALEVIMRGVALAITLPVDSDIALSQSRDLDHVATASPAELTEGVKRHVWPDYRFNYRSESVATYGRDWHKAPATMIPLPIRELSAPRHYGKKAPHQRLALMETPRDIGPAAEDAVRSGLAQR